MGDDEERSGQGRGGSASPGVSGGYTESSGKSRTGFRRENWAGDPEVYRQLQLRWQEALLHDLQRIFRGKNPAVAVTVAAVSPEGETVTLAVHLPLQSLSAAGKAAVREEL